MGQLKLAASLILLGLFSFALISFAEYFANDNNAAVSITGDGAIYDQVGNINQSLEVFNDGVNQTMVNYGQADFSSGADASSAASTVKANSGEYIDLGISSVETGFRSVVGGDARYQIFFYSILAFIGLSIILYSWAALKGGIVE